jgi:hypothetical protein
MFEKLKQSFIFWLARRTPDCKTITPILGEANNRPLTLREKINVKVHLFICQACQRYFNQIKFLHDFMSKNNHKFQVETDSSAPKLSDKAKQRLKNALKSTTTLAF